MNTKRVNFAHMLATTNPKHVESLVKLFESGSKPDGPFGFGIEIEHLPVHNGSDTAVTYYEPNGIETLLKRLAPYYDPEKEYWENDHLVGLARKGVAISLEPGGQFECSLDVLHDPREVSAAYRAFRREVDTITEELGFRLVEYGYQPVSSFADVPLNPKSRYSAMNAYLGRIGECGPMMMRCSSATQVSIDFKNERDAIAKMRIGSAIGPILAWFFWNSPYCEGEVNPFPLLRQRMWDWMDPQRTGLTPGLFNPHFSWEDYAVDVLSTPLMFADLTHTPELKDTVDDPHVIAWHENAGEIYPDRALNTYEVNHILSTHFNDVRLKNFVELRHWDSLPIERVERLTEIINELFYDERRLERLQTYFDGLTEEDVLEAKANIQAQGRNAGPYGQPLGFWQEFLGLEGIMPEIPGDPAHPDVFQE
ncbi:glutamate-cysteine ligase family protein [Bifidobacterium sp.]|jgi:glutamate--cysteine ligase|uniref:glutamate-cysteine ligase family protein n=1 Tax=Bifidobacterium sp. TaxID=41200 RepID=UPI0025BD1438|nr:glutamate-cysteine ligase family protein [Bifidobacterium sp.]MCI1636240.1 glutamate-cysteine ligase family protein [Bifidobacterium sp.]